MRLWRRKRTCWWCGGKGRWTPWDTDNQMGWLHVHPEIECSECNGTGLALWVRRQGRHRG